MNRLSNTVSCLLACLVMACTADPIEPQPGEESLGEVSSEIDDTDCEAGCDPGMCRRPGGYGWYVYGYVQGNYCVTYNGQFSVSCDAPNVDCGVCWDPCP